MIATNNRATLRDVMYAMSLAKPVPDAELLDDFVRRYPRHAEALTEFAIELAVDALLHDDNDLDIPADPNVVSSVVSRVMSRFQNRLFELRQRQAVHPRSQSATAFVENPFSSLDRERFRALATRINANNVLLSKLRDRLIDPTTIPPKFCEHVAEAMDKPLETLTAHLYAHPEVAHGRQLFKAEGKPTAAGHQTFDEAVRGSGLSEEQQRRLLSFRD